MRGIIVHGGCGRMREGEKDRTLGLDAAASAGWKALARGSALDAVVAAVVAMEDDPTFNAGTGAVLNFDGEVETDASVMTSDGRQGAIAAVRGVKNPVLLAREVCLRTDHLLLAGRGAEKFARMCGMEQADLVTPERRARWKELRALMGGGKRFPDRPELRFWKRLKALREKYLADDGEGRHGTVGAAAVDAKGMLAAATSTGGIWFKLPGRVGDTPVFGAGTYAGRWGAASATGHGEGIVRLDLTRYAVSLMREMEAQAAADEAIARAREQGVECGLIAIDYRGRTGAAFAAEQMPVASKKG